MWSMTKRGFISVVEYDPGKDKSPGSPWAKTVTSKGTHLLVRGRVKADLEELKSVVKNHVVIEDNHADYLYRTVVTRRQLKKWLAQQVDEIDYGSHFKEASRDAIKDRDGEAAGLAWHGAMMSVWTALLRLQPFKKYEYTGGVWGKGKFGKAGSKSYTPVGPGSWKGGKDHGRDYVWPSTTEIVKRDSLDERLAAEQPEIWDYDTDRWGDVGAGNEWGSYGPEMAGTSESDSDYGAAARWNEMFGDVPAKREWTDQRALRILGPVYVAQRVEQLGMAWLDDNEIEALNDDGFEMYVRLQETFGRENQIPPTSIDAVMQELVDDGKLDEPDKVQRYLDNLLKLGAKTSADLLEEASQAFEEGRQAGLTADLEVIDQVAREQALRSYSDPGKRTEVTVELPGEPDVS